MLEARSKAKADLRRHETALCEGFHGITRYLLDNGVTVDIPSVCLCNCRAPTSRPTDAGRFPLYTALRPLHLAAANAMDDVLKLTHRRTTYSRFYDKSGR
ncbi:hypothetical protein J3F83DRAFT_735472 [Trichoderma novae-zelandiae]